MGRKPKISPLPANWPTDTSTSYLASPVRSKHLTPTQHSLLSCPPAKDAPVESPSHTPPVLITPIQDPSHPAHNQHGLFAASPLPPGAFILFYTGYIHNCHLPVDNDPTSDYDLSIDRDAGLAIDATRMGNEARFVNDYRGVPGRETKGPNAEFRDCWVKLPGGKHERRVGVYVLPEGRAGKAHRKEGVKKGEEILVSYGKGFWCKGAGKGEGEGEGQWVTETAGLGAYLM